MRLQRPLRSLGNIYERLRCPKAKLKVDLRDVRILAFMCFSSAVIGKSERLLPQLHFFDFWKVPFQLANLNAHR
ncbi:conserved hypothetical protein [Agrobacterium deltaense RV3]|nr:conserved hypothetical protein [Agrobacterium deltaense RV3]